MYHLGDAQGWGNGWAFGPRSEQLLGTALDKFNRTTFTPVETTGLRIEVQLQPKFSGGILKWRVE